jgi:RNA polymerase sigma factor (sigma-70 family)
MLPHTATVLPFSTTCDALDDPNDRCLLDKLHEGDEEAGARLYFLYARRLLALMQKRLGSDLATRFDPEDVMQSVFGSFFRRIREGSYDVPESGDLWPLLLVIASNKIVGYDRYLKAARRNIRREIQNDARPSGDKTIEQLQAIDSPPYLRLILEEAIEKLPPKYREVVRWRLEGYHHDEIAARLCRSRRSVERILQVSFLRLQQQLPEFQNGCSYRPH